MTGRPWVFLTHTLDQVGPPVFLLHFLRWVREHSDTEVVVVALEDGRLRRDFEALGGVVVLGEPEPVRQYRRGERPATALRDWARRTRLRDLGDPGLVYVNTAYSTRLRSYLPAYDAPLVTHVHELKIGLDYHLPAPDWAGLLADTDHWVAASRAVATNLQTRHGVAPDAIAVHHEMIRIDDRKPLITSTELRRRHGIPDDAPLVGTAAVVDWRKAPDLFIELAWRLTRGDERDTGAHFLWIGGRPDEPNVLRFHDDLAAAGLEGRVHLLAAVGRPLDFMQAFDLFVLTAREDAFPLACLEAASVGCPIVCFDAGGMPEFVEDDAGAVVPYPDVRAFAGTVTQLLDDAERAKTLGVTGAAKVRARHDAELAAPRLYADLKAWAKP